MNLPNKLTVLRMVLVPVFMAVLLLWNRYVALGIFIFASLTDFVDGKLARSRGLVTNFGKFMDPLADKLLVLSAMVIFVQEGRMPGWVCMVVIARELAVSGLRMVAASNGVVMAAGWSGKIKTACTMVGLCVVIGCIIHDTFNTEARHIATVRNRAVAGVPTHLGRTFRVVRTQACPCLEILPRAQIINIEVYTDALHVLIEGCAGVLLRVVVHVVEVVGIVNCDESRHAGVVGKFDLLLVETVCGKTRRFCLVGVFPPRTVRDNLFIDGYAVDTIRRVRRQKCHFDRLPLRILISVFQ